VGVGEQPEWVVEERASAGVVFVVLSKASFDVGEPCADAVLEGYSEPGSVELEGDDCGDGGGECVEGSAVVGVQDSPGLEVGDGAFDPVADLVDRGVELLLPVEELTAGSFADWCDHFQADVALVAQMLGACRVVEQTGLAHRARRGSCPVAGR